MVSDDERRRVARKLRSFVTDDSVYADVDACRVLHSIGLYYKDIDRIYFSGFDVARLADLIEPSCDREALLELADKLECDGDCNGCDMGGGIWCGAQVYAARRIREACGVVDAG